MTGPTGTGARAVPRTLVAGVVSTAGFAAGCVLTQVVTVPMWRRMEPEAFFEGFARTGPATGTVLLPLDVCSVSLLGAATVSAVRRREPSQLRLAVATAAMAGTLLLLPAYFARANDALLEPGRPVGDLAGELAAWNRWNWLRTGLAVAATVLAGAAIGASGRPRRSVRPRWRRILR